MWGIDGSVVGHVGGCVSVLFVSISLTLSTCKRTSEGIICGITANSFTCATKGVGGSINGILNTVTRTVMANGASRRRSRCTSTMETDMMDNLDGMEHFHAVRTSCVLRHPTSSRRTFCISNAVTGVDAIAGARPSAAGNTPTGRCCHYLVSIAIGLGSTRSSAIRGDRAFDVASDSVS